MTSLLINANALHIPFPDYWMPLPEPPEVELGKRG